MIVWRQEEWPAAVGTTLGEAWYCLPTVGAWDGVGIRPHLGDGDDRGHGHCPEYTQTDQAEEQFERSRHTYHNIPLSC
jgi:hypothetical protein